jgi:hypothetical protein
MRNSAMVTREPQHVVHDKSQVVKKALAELIATKWRLVKKQTGKEQALDLMAESIANKGRYMEQSSMEPIKVSNPIQVRLFQNKIKHFFKLN